MNALKKIQYNCNKATFLIEKRMLDKITLRERVELYIHLITCLPCRLFAEQSQNINQMVKQLFQKPVVKLGEDEKQQMHTLIEQEIDKEKK